MPSGGDCTGGGLCSSIRDTLRTRGVGLWRGEALALDPDAVPATGLLVKLYIVHRHAKPPEHSIARILGHPYELLLVPFLLDLDTVGEGLELGVGFRLEFGEMCIVCLALLVDTHLARRIQGKTIVQSFRWPLLAVAEL